MHPSTIQADEHSHKEKKSAFGSGTVVTHAVVLSCSRAARFVAAGAAAEAISQRGLTSKTQIEVIIRSFNWLVWLLAGLNMLTEGEVRLWLEPATCGTLHAVYGTDVAVVWDGYMPLSNRVLMWPSSRVPSRAI